MYRDPSAPKCRVGRRTRSQESPRYRPAAADRSVCCVLILCVTRARSDPRLTSQWPARCPGALGERIIVRGSDSSEAAGAAHAMQNCFRKLLQPLRSRSVDVLSWLCGCRCLCLPHNPASLARPAARHLERGGTGRVPSTRGQAPGRSPRGRKMVLGLIQCCWCSLTARARAFGFGTFGANIACC